ncbi:hypothetical protein IJ182_08480 [bacterium]|nr:hypothetical protein [bacterium]
MAIRVLLILLALFIMVNFVISLVSLICNVNLYKKYGNRILKGFGVFILLIVITYIVMAILGLT